MDTDLDRAELRARVAQLPTGPGVYLWRDAAGKVLYVGKAAQLRSRVRSYLGRGDGRPLVRFLMRRAVTVEAISTATAGEAMLLENTLIKRERPPYNLRLKDDKSFLLVRVDRKHEFPRLALVRRVKRDGAQYLGPFAQAEGLRRTLRYLRTLFPLRTCSDRELEERTRPCLYHQMGRCAAPCVGLISQADYRTHLEGTLAALRGRDDGIVADLRRDMAAAAEELEFERAALARDRLAALEASLARQDVVATDGKDRDAIAVVRGESVAMMGMVYVRDGHVVATRVWPERTTAERRDILLVFLAQAYERGRVVPPEILLEELPDDAEALEARLAELRGGPVALRVPIGGIGRDLLALAERNARQGLVEHAHATGAAWKGLERLAELIGLPRPPQRIECFDLSHLGGDDPVAGMSVLVGGVADSRSYRHFAIREAEGGDDFAGIEEVVRRRFAADERLGPKPDLLVVDGGQGQVQAALRALAAFEGPVPAVIGLAKARTRQGTRSEERIVLPGVAEPLVPEATDAAVRLLVKARDEAHRFAGRYQLKRRSSGFVRSVLDGVAGLGPVGRRRLLRRFGSVEGIRQAPFEDLAALPGIGERIARRIHERLGATDSSSSDAR